MKATVYENLPSPIQGMDHQDRLVCFEFQYCLKGLINRPYQTETNKMHPKKSWPKLIFGTVIKPIEFSNISKNQPNLS